MLDLFHFDLLALLKVLGLVNNLKEVLDGIERKRADKDLVAQREVRNRKRVEAIRLNRCDEVLRRYYTDDALAEKCLARYAYAVDGHVMSTTSVVRKEWLGLHTNVSELEASFEERVPPPPFVSKEEGLKLIEELGAEGRRVFNKPMYRLTNMEFGQRKRRVSFGLSTFAESVFSSVSLEEELFQALLDADLCSENVTVGSRKLSLPQRDLLLPTVDSLLGYRNRLCVGGCFVLLAFATPGPKNGYVFFAKQRSSEVASNRGVASLIPTGYHQPTSISLAEEEVGIANSILVEIGEELFDLEELIEPKNRLHPGWYFDIEPALSWFREHPQSYTAQVVCSSLNLMQGNYEFGILIAVHDLSYLEKFGPRIKFNWEIDKSEVDDIDIARFSTLKPNRIEEALCNPLWAGTARMTLIESLRRLKKIDPTRVKMPKVQEISFGLAKAAVASR